jgi:hypothetical protein
MRTSLNKVEKIYHITILMDPTEKKRIKRQGARAFSCCQNDMDMGGFPTPASREKHKISAHKPLAKKEIPCTI